jgi:hypothetical protein
LEDLEYRLDWTGRDLRAHELLLDAQAEVALHLAGLPKTLAKEVFDQIDANAKVLGDGGSAMVREHARVLVTGEDTCHPALYGDKRRLLVCSPLVAVTVHAY